LEDVAIQMGFRYALCAMRYAFIKKEEDDMAKIEAIIKSEIVRLAKREVRKIAIPVGRDVRTLKSTVSQLRKAVLEIGRFVARQKAVLEKEKGPLEASQEEATGTRLSPFLIRRLRRRLGISQRALATLAGVTVGAVYQWETGKFKPRGEKKAFLVALRKLRRREVENLIEEKKAEKKAKEVRKPRQKSRPRRARKASKK